MEPTHNFPLFLTFLVVGLLTLFCGVGLYVWDMAMSTSPPLLYDAKQAATSTQAGVGLGVPTAPTTTVQKK